MNVYTVLGMLLIIAACAWTAFNMYEERRAGDEAASALSLLEQENARVNGGGAASDGEGSAPNLSESQGTAFQPDTPMPTQVIDGNLYVGTLRIPDLGLELPVMSEWSYDNLEIAPCRYAGSVYADDMVIAAHNYRTHFGDLHELDYGSEVSFTDIRGNVFVFEVATLETLDGGDVDDMLVSEWDLTLFTCNFSGSERVTVRCDRVW